MDTGKDRTWKIELTDNDGIKTSWESPKWDSTTSELIQAFAGLMISHTFVPKSVYETMKEFAEEQMELCKDSE